MAIHERELAGLRNNILLAIAGALAVIALAGWVSARQAIQPVAELTRAMERITASGLDQRLSAGQAAHEFERMIVVFNGMIDRLAKSFHQATRFSADAAHELKTPLTILQGHLEQALNEAATGSLEQRRYSALLEEVQRLKTIIRKLLILARADTGELQLHRKPIDMSEAVRALCDDVRVLAPALNLETRMDPGLWVLADPELLQQALQNLVNNAIKYNNARQQMKLGLDVHEGRVRLRIANTCDAIPTEAAGKLFDRFYRVDAARNRVVDGQGLGLSLVKEIIEAHGGAVRASLDDPGWALFEIVLPPLHAPGGALP